MNKEFGYYKTLLKRVRDGKSFGINRINEMGGRMSGKTWSAVEFSIIACLVAKVKVDAFRWMKGVDKKELFNQFRAIILQYPGLINVVKVHLSSSTYTFPNGSVIEVSGTRTMGSSEVQLTGKSGASQFDYHIAIAEERFQIDDKLWSNVQQALRGAKNYLEIHLSNPWIFTNDYVEHCNNVLPFNIDILKRDGQQFLKHETKVKLPNGQELEFIELFHYTNFNISENLGIEDKIRNIKAAEHDPNRADTILYGYPGSPEGSIWKWVLPKMKQIPVENSVVYTGGVDYGERKDATAAYIIGFAPNYTHAHIEHEYYHANDDDNLNRPHKDTNVLAKEVVEHFIEFYEQRELNGILEVYVDGSAIPFITALNTYAQSENVDSYISFMQQSDKDHVADRIETLKTMASFGLITVDSECLELLRELTEQVYSNKTRSSKDYVDGDDHGTDAIFYGIRPHWVELLENMKILKEMEIEEELSKKEVENGN